MQRGLVLANLMHPVRHPTGGWSRGGSIRSARQLFLKSAVKSCHVFRLRLRGCRHHHHCYGVRCLPIAGGLLQEGLCSSAIAAGHDARLLLHAGQTRAELMLDCLYCASAPSLQLRW